MRLTQKLLSFLHRRFDATPDQTLALRLQYSSGVMTWTVADATLTIWTNGYAAPALVLDLTQYTIASLVNFLAAQVGFSVAYMGGPDVNLLGARTLVDGSGDISQSNGDHLYAYTNPLWSFMEAASNELGQAETQIDNAVLQMSTATASAEWLDELGGYYGVPRASGELDSSYGPRIITEVLRPRGNNVAIEAALKAYTGQTTKVTDVVVYNGATITYNNTFNYNSVHLHNSASASQIFGLFDVQLGYDLINGADATTYLATVTSLIERLRDAGTHMRSLALTGSVISDTFTPPTDSASLTVNLLNFYDATSQHNTLISYSGARSSSASL